MEFTASVRVVAHGGKVLCADAMWDAIARAFIAVKDFGGDAMEKADGFIVEVVGGWEEEFTTSGPRVFKGWLHDVVGIVVEGCETTVSGVGVEVVVAMEDPLLCH